MYFGSIATHPVDRLSHFDYFQDSQLHRTWDPPVDYGLKRKIPTQPALAICMPKTQGHPRTAPNQRTWKNTQDLVGRSSSHPDDHISFWPKSSDCGCNLNIRVKTIPPPFRGVKRRFRGSGGRGSCSHGSSLSSAPTWRVG